MRNELAMFGCTVLTLETIKDLDLCSEVAATKGRAKILAERAMSILSDAQELISLSQQSGTVDRLAGASQAINRAKWFLTQD